MSAKICIPSTFSKSVLEENFWPKFVHCKLWQQNETVRKSGLHTRNENAKTPFNSCIMANQIPIRISARKFSAKKSKPRHACRNLIKVKIIERETSKPRQIPKCLVLNARSLVKADAYPALYAELNSNNIDLCFISETWLHSAIPSSLICPPGYGIARKDRENTRGGGVAILCRNDWRMENILEVENMFECTWMKIVVLPRPSSGGSN